MEFCTVIQIIYLLILLKLHLHKDLVTLFRTFHLFHNPLKLLLIPRLIVNADLITSCAVNCGGKQTTNPDSLSSTFYDDTSDLGAAGFHVNSDRQWVVSNVGSDPLTLSNSPGIVNANQVNLGTDLPELYRTARTSRSDLWYYVVGLSNGKYTVQLFFAEIVIESELNSGLGRRSFNIDIQVCSLKITSQTFTFSAFSPYVTFTLSAFSPYVRSEIMSLKCRIGISRQILTLLRKQGVLEDPQT
jgi:hypothetical protein